MRKQLFGFGLIAVFATAAMVQSASAQDYRYTSRAELYEAQAREYVAARTQAVNSRTRYVQPRVDHMRVVAPQRTRTVYVGGYVNVSQPQVYHNASYRDSDAVTVVQEVSPNDGTLLLEDTVADSDPGVVQNSYMQQSSPSQASGLQPSHYGSYSSYPSAGSYTPASSYSSETVVVYRSYPAYRPRYVYCPPPPRYHYSRYHHRPHGHYDRWRHCNPYPRYGVGGYYGRGGRCGSNWGVSVYFRF